MPGTTVNEQDAKRSALPYGAFAVALYAAPDLPYPERVRLSPGRLAEYAERGAERLGGVEGVHAIYSALLALNRAVLGNGMDMDVYETRVQDLLLEVWPEEGPDVDRLNRCISYDYGRLRST